MDLIDKNKLDSFKYRSASERMDLPVDYMVGWNDAVDGIMCNAPTVEAIPIEWIKERMNNIEGTMLEMAWSMLISDWAERKDG